MSHFTKVLLRVFMEKMQNNIRYAADTALIAGSEKDLQSLLNIVVTEWKERIITECKEDRVYGCVQKKANNPQCNLLSKGEKIKQSEISKNLGYMLTSDGKCFKNEVQRRFAIAKDTFNKMSPILKK